MGIKKMFKMKPDPEATPEQNREELMTQGIAVKSEKQRKEKFSAFKDYARNKNDNREELKPRIVDPNRSAANPYLNMNRGGTHSYGDIQESRQSSASPNPYANAVHSNSETNFNDGFHQQQQPAYQGARHAPENSRPQNPYALQRAETNQSSRTQGTRYDTSQYQSQLLADNATINTMTTDLNEVPNYSMNQVALQDEEEDLNRIPEEYHDETDLTAEEMEQLKLQEEEDEAVNQIKADIRFTKQQSVASTRNTLRMAEEAHASGANTLGMLGSQSERLYGIQRNLALADVQNKMADDKTKEMAKLNRSMFAVHASNPFNSKRRLRQQEEKIKQTRMNEKLLADRQRAEMHTSERRVLGGLKEPHNSSTTGEIYNKYNDRKILDNAKRYQFENDSEDDDMEREIHQNLSAIGDHAGNLKKMAMTIGKETESQNRRMNDIEEDADRLDINVHLNNHRLNGMH